MELFQKSLGEGDRYLWVYLRVRTTGGNWWRIGASLAGIRGECPGHPSMSLTALLAESEEPGWGHPWQVGQMRKEAGEAAAAGTLNVLSSIFASMQFKSNPICHMVLFITKVFANLLVTKRDEEDAARVNS